MSDRSGRRLSPFRVVLALLVVAVVVGTGLFGAQWWAAQALPGGAKPWFGAYVDVTAQPVYAFEQPSAGTKGNVVLSFVVASRSGPCTPSWGSAYSLAAAAGELDLDRRIARLRQLSGDVAVSFGGQANQELALTCTDPARLMAAYRSVVERYTISTVDFDLEGAALADPASEVRRAHVIAALQQERQRAGKPLAVWVTLPVSPTGLTPEGTDAVARLLAAHVDLAGVDVMTMDYGGSLPAGTSMLAGSEQALEATHRQLGILYDRAHLHQTDAGVWTRIGATPMIGQNDIAGEIFTPGAAAALNGFARAHHLGRVSMWSANRDATCGSNWVDVRIVSVACSGVDESTTTFAGTLGKGFTGRIAGAAVRRTTPQPTVTPSPDQASSSPYPIWSRSSVYLAGTKVSWHHEVFVAKWWTRGDVPDDPVLQSFQTPWQLVGPVLPGDRPAPRPSLPVGLFPQWSGTKDYQTGAHVLLNGVPFEAKWWNTGESPAAAAVNPDGSPWAQLTEAQALAVRPTRSPSPSPSPSP
jgi:chitinase